MTSLNTLQDHSARGSFDELYTPPEAVAPLLKYLDRFSVIWEPTDHGSSIITQILEEEGKVVFGTHIAAGDDFLSTPRGPVMAQAIITNPPYSLKDKFLARAYEIGLPFAFLLPTVSLSGIRRNKLFRQHGLELIVLDKRIDFNGKGAVWFPVTWFCWKILPQPNSIVFEEVS